MGYHSNKNQQLKPLVVDMDGTLLKTDMLYESANNFILRHPSSLVYLLSWLCKGKPYLKARLAEVSLVDVTELPYNRKVISLLEQQKLLGRTIVLATASHHLLAEAISQHLGLFDEVMATDEINLKSESKRDLLVERFGVQGFDYIGNNNSDLAVWKSADKAYVVSSSTAFIAKARTVDNQAEVIPASRPPVVKTLFKAVRAHQWVKNLLLFIPLLAAHTLVNLSGIFNLLIAFVVFCLTASSVYVLNDLIDISNDRHHPNKCQRPFAAGNLSLLMGWALWPTLLIISAVITGLLLPGLFFVVIAAYFILTLTYSLKLKQLVIVDVVTLAVLYTLRIIAGAKASETPLSFWLLAFSIFIFLSLAFIKRYSELYSASERGGNVHLKGRGYVHQDLNIIATMGISAGYLAVLILAFYVQDPHTTGLYHYPKFIWLACPLLLYWISRAWLITTRGRMHDDPIIFAIKDRISWLVGICFVGVFVLATTYG